jgi:hypothetical protein
VKFLQQCLRLQAAAQDPPAVSDKAPRPQRPADMAAFAIFDTALRQAFAQDALVPATAPLWQDGFLPALLTVRDLHLVDGFFALLTTSLDRYQAVTGKTATVSTMATTLAQAMETYQYPPRPDLQPYAQRLRARYPETKQ